jgi:hypothetical protein
MREMKNCAKIQQFQTIKRDGINESRRLKESKNIPKMPLK